MGNYPGSTPTDYNPSASEVLGTAASVGIATILVDFSDEIIALANKVGTGSSTPSNGTVLIGDGSGTSSWSSTLPAVVFSGNVDLDANRLILDANQDTYLEADVDNIINIATGGTERVRISNSGLFMFSGAIYTDDVNEFSTGNGITLDGLNIKDSKLNTDDSVVTDNITDDAVTDAKRTRMSATQISDTSTTALSTTYAKVDFDTEDFDDPGWGDLTNNRITVDEAGLYLMLAEFSDDQSASGEQIRARIYKNGSALSPERYVSGISSEISAGSLHYMGTLAANDYIELWARNDSGDANNIDRPVLTVIKLSD